MKGLCGLVVARLESEVDYGCEIGVGMGIRQGDLGIQAGVSVMFPAIKVK